MAWGKSSAKPVQTVSPLQAAINARLAANPWAISPTEKYGQAISAALKYLKVPEPEYIRIMQKIVSNPEAAYPILTYLRDVPRAPGTFRIDDTMNTILGTRVTTANQMDLAQRAVSGTLRPTTTPTTATSQPQGTTTTVKPITTVTNTTSGQTNGTATTTQLQQVARQGQIEQAMRDAGMDPARLPQYASVFGTTPEQIKAKFSDAIAQGGAVLSTVIAVFKQNIQSPEFQRRLASTSQIGTAATTPVAVVGGNQVVRKPDGSEWVGGMMVSPPKTVVPTPVVGTPQPTGPAVTPQTPGVTPPTPPLRGLPNPADTQTIGANPIPAGPSAAELEAERIRGEQQRQSQMAEQARIAQEKAQAEARQRAINEENARIAREKKIQTDAIARQQEADAARSAVPGGARRGRNTAWQSAIGGSASGVGAQRFF